ncbi:MAG: hypothetical protein QXG00_01980 [Candidatus Woesearchaeota archaeon]
MKKDNIILNILIILMIVCIFLSIFLSASAFGEEFYLTTGQTITFNKQDITLKGVSENQTLFFSGEKNKIIQTGNSARLGEVRIYVKEVGMLNEEYKKKGARVDICDIHIDESCNGIDDNCDGKIDNGLKNCTLNSYLTNQSSIKGVNDISEEEKSRDNNNNNKKNKENNEEKSDSITGKVSGRESSQKDKDNKITDSEIITKEKDSL